MFTILVLIISCSCVLATGENEKIDVFRLPNNTEPLFYKLTITPYIDPTQSALIFEGDVYINIKVKTSTEELTLNADGLNITQIYVTDTTNTSSPIQVKVFGFNLVIKNEQLKIKLVEPGLIADRAYEVRIVYSGELRNDMTGFYKSSYIDKESKNIKWLAVTQFEPTYARRAFPCYDEPQFKTPFSINIVRRDTQMSLSNMPRDRYYQIYDLPLNYICDQFQTTKPMSTYSVAFSVSEFVNTNSETQKIYVYTHKEYIDQVNYIEEKAHKLLNLMEIYTNIPYPYSKLDFLAVPDFSYNAMENWGLNTYKEKYLLVTAKSSEKDKELVTTTVQRELSHQWFGNLVTCSWWSHVWLNEAFATLFQYYAVEVAEPSWKVGDLFVIEQHQSALALDHRPKHPMTASVNTPKEIKNIFDPITGSKGAAVLRMLKHTLNDEIFRTSLSLYLITYMYKSVEPKNLWDSFDNVLFDNEYKLGILGDKITVGEFMTSWTDQAGYPVIHVDTSHGSDSLIISQKRFQVDEPKLDDTTLWHIGLTYTTRKHNDFNNVLPLVWLNNTQTKVTIQLEKDAGWVLFNLQSTGFYRVNYDLNNWNLLIEQLKNNPKSIHILNRAQLVDDSFNLARAGELPYTVPFNLVDYLYKEDDFIPWYSVKNSMSYLVERSRSCRVTGPQIKEFTKKYAEIIYQKVKDPTVNLNTEHLKKTSMNEFSNWACKLEVDDCVQDVLLYFNKWLQNGTEILPDIKEAAFCYGIKNGTEETWNVVFELYKNTLSTSERQAALMALACSTNKTVLSNYLDLLLSPNCPIRPQDYKTMFESMSSTPLGINVKTDFLQNYINQSLSSLWENEETIMLMYSTLAAHVATANEINQLNTIRNNTYLSPTLKESFDESYHEVKLNSAYFMRVHPDLHSFFNPTKQDTSTQAPSSAISNSYKYVNAIGLSLIFVLTQIKTSQLFYV